MKKWLNIYLVLDKRYKEHIYFCPWKKRWLQPRKIKNAAPKIFITYLLGAVARTHWWITLETLPRRFMRSMESKNTPDDLPQAANLGPLTSRAKRRRSKGSVCVCTISNSLCCCSTILDSFRHLPSLYNSFDCCQASCCWPVVWYNLWWVIKKLMKQLSVFILHWTCETHIE